MKKADFYGTNKISDKRPKDILLSHIQDYDFESALSKFIDSNFRAAAAVEFEHKSCGVIMICEEYTAYFFKLLLKYTFGRKFINIRIDTTDTELNINIYSDGGLPLDYRQKNELIKTARSSGFEVRLTDMGFVLYTALHKNIELAVYVHNSSKRLFYLALVDMFFD